jgi:hypothetical protein
MNEIGISTVGALVAGLLVLGISTTLTAPLAAEEPQELSEDNSEADDVAADLERRRRLEGVFGTGYQAPEWWQRWGDKRDGLFERVGLDFGANYHAVGLVAFGRGDPDTGFGGDFTLNGTWHLGGDRWNLPLDLRFRVRDRHAFGDVPPSAIAGETGALWGLVDGFSDAGFEIPDFQLVQRIPDRGVEIRYGQMVIESQFDRHALRSSKQAFLNRAFSSNPAVAFPRFGVGMTLHKKVRPGIRLHGRRFLGAGHHERDPGGLRLGIRGLLQGAAGRPGFRAERGSGPVSGDALALGSCR